MTLTQEQIDKLKEGWVPEKFGTAVRVTDGRHTGIITDVFTQEGGTMDWVKWKVHVTTPGPDQGKDVSIDIPLERSGNICAAFEALGTPVDRSALSPDVFESTLLTHKDLEVSFKAKTGRDKKRQFLDFQGLTDGQTGSMDEIPF